MHDSISSALAVSTIFGVIFLFSIIYSKSWNRSLLVGAPWRPKEEHFWHIHSFTRTTRLVLYSLLWFSIMSFPFSSICTASQCDVDVLMKIFPSEMLDIFALEFLGWYFFKYIGIMASKYIGIDLTEMIMKPRLRFRILQACLG